MDAKIFTYVVALSRCGSYSQAARELGITPQGLNGAVKRLESELGVPLVGQTEGSVSLTEYGRFFVDRAQVIADEIESARNGIAAMRSHLNNVVRLGCAIGMLGYLGEDIVDRYNEQSGAQVMLAGELPDTVCEQRLLDGAYDVCLITAPVLRRGIISTPIVRDYQFFWVSRSNPLSKLDEIRLADLDGQTVCTLRDDYKSTDVFLDLCRQAGVHVRMRYTTEMINVYEHARTGDALGLTCRNHVAATADSQLTVGRPFKSLPWGIVACRPSDATPSEATLQFVEYLRAMSRDYVGGKGPTS